MNGTYHLDLDKINKSVETISGIEDCISNRDLSEAFSELENYFRDINFEHGNCLKYKEEMELIFININKIKRKISNLADALITTTENFSDIESLDSKDIKELTSIYRNTPTSEKLGDLISDGNVLRKSLTADLYSSNDQDGTVSRVPQVEEPLEEYTVETINTVPIGIAIGAAGIAGSIGAVVVNEKYGRKTKNKTLTEMDDETLFASTETNKDNIFQNDEENTEFYDETYRASRKQREADKYYGNEELLEDEDQEINNDDHYE